MTLVAVPERLVAHESAAIGSARQAETEILETLIVTVQRREQNPQDVPIALTAIGDDALAARNTVDLSDLVGAVPGLSIAGFTGGNASNLVSIRGVAGQVLPIGSGQPVAIYLDDVYLSRPDAAFFGLDDVERIEVLRGPQGTLYGRNATAGAINIITRTPGSLMEGGGELSVGSLDEVSARGSVRTPLGGGFSAGVSASYHRHEGYIRNTVTGNLSNSRDAHTVRGRFQYQSRDDAFEAVLAGDYTGDEATPIFKNAFAASGAFVGFGDPEEFASDASSEAQTMRRTVNKGVALRLRRRVLDSLELVSISSWRDIGTATVYDADASEQPFFVTGADNESAIYSQEIRGVFTGSRVRATAGANWFKEQASYGLSTSPPSTRPSFDHLLDTSDLTAWAAFAQLEADLAEQLTVVGGLRYDNERRDFTIDYRAAPTPGRLLSGRVEDDVVIPSLTVMYRMQPDVMFYAKASRGYQPPGFNFAPGALATTSNTFAAETLWAYEAGAKIGLFYQRVTFDAAAFHYDYSDIQIRSTIGLGLARVDNAAAAALQGAEVSMSAKLPGGFSISSQATYLHARYRQFCQPISAAEPQGSDALCSPRLADRSGNRLNLAPTWSGGVEIAHQTQLGSGRITATASYGFSTSMFYVGAANEQVASSGCWGRLRARIAFQMRNGPEFFVYGRNLTDDRFLEFAARVGPASMFEVMNEPRTYGVGIGYRF
ncbi:MAG TPA: TonB-dependent receptor [Steroidobacter sp.]|uniref:TonB-dependent receptor n=1 Tax=Steroidobacter sp. TaxID=1978227 RepID=UPI002ED9ED30